MAFDWNQYIDVGRELCSKKEQKYIRAGISRAYYGLYNKLRLHKGLTTRYRPHKELIDKLLLAEIFEEEADLSFYLQQLKKFREESDYDGIQVVDERYSKDFWLRFDTALEIFEKNK